MAIQWFPGHMHLTKKAIQERIKEIDVVIELLDARLPGSSANPMLAELTSGKPALKVLNAAFGKKALTDDELAMKDDELKEHVVVELRSKAQRQSGMSGFSGESVFDVKRAQAK